MALDQRGIPMSRTNVFFLALLMSTLLWPASPNSFAQVMFNVPAPPGPPDKSIIKFNAAVKLMNRQQFAEAAEKFKEAAELKPSWSEAYFYEALALTHVEKFDEALPLLDKVLELRPKYQQAALEKAICLEH